MPNIFQSTLDLHNCYCQGVIGGSDSFLPICGICFPLCGRDLPYFISLNSSYFRLFEEQFNMSLASWLCLHKYSWSHYNDTGQPVLKFHGQQLGSRPTQDRIKLLSHGDTPVTALARNQTQNLSVGNPTCWMASHHFPLFSSPLIFCWT